MQIGKRIGILMGGLSSERDQSIRSGDAVFNALRERGHDAVKIFVDGDLDIALRSERIDLAFLALHGRYGEDGCVQGLLELFGIPYTASSVLASSLAMDKLKAKELFRLHNLPTPPYYVHRRGAGSAVEQHGSFGFPAVVKPRAEGSSLGVCYVREIDELEQGIEEALRFDDHVLVERHIDGTEVHVALVGSQPIGAVEIARDRPIFDYAARSGSGGAELLFPPKSLTEERLRGAIRFAIKAQRALESSGLCEVDLIISDRGNEYLLEIDTQPQMGDGSVIALLADSMPIGFGGLCEMLLTQATLHTRRRPCDRDRRERRLMEMQWVGPERRANMEPH